MFLLGLYQNPAIMPALLLISRRTNNPSGKLRWLPFNPLGRAIDKPLRHGSGTIRGDCFRSQPRTDFVSPDLIILADLNPSA
jgi:hypothetical protein